MLGTVLLILVGWFLVSIPASLLAARLLSLNSMMERAQPCTEQETIAARTYSRQPF